MDADEVVAVLAHEIGHWKKRHVLKRIIVSEVLAFVSFYIAFQVLKSDILLRIFSIESDSFFAEIVIIGFIGSILAFPFSPLSNYFSRRHERQADRFACDISGDPVSMAGALIKLSKDNLSNLHPHPFYAVFHYSHPPIVQRIRDIRAMKV
jgi:STE24 endopeptidase